MALSYKARMLTNETITKEEYGRDNKDILEHKHTYNQSLAPEILIEQYGRTRRQIWHKQKTSTTK